MIFCSLATVAFGLWPALRLSRPDLLSSLKDHAGEVSGRIAARITVRDALVTAQLALSLALLVLSGLFVRGAAAGAAASPGFDAGPLAIAQIDPALGGYDAAQGREAHRAVLEKLRSTPGIESVAEASVLPFGEYSSGAAVQRGGPRLKSEDPDAAGQLLRVQSYTVTSDYFKTLGLRMVQGREFTAAEEATVGVACSDLPDQPARSGDVASRHRHSCGLVAVGVNHSGSTSGERSPDDGAQEQLTRLSDRGSSVDRRRSFDDALPRYSRRRRSKRNNG